ncbi:radical SAM protein [Aquirufa rosea]|uniref:7-carboxy-7-deazaguanine synthase n=2 Tax=Aquirufa rosea TaxID=2509241 RepID=A0A4Q1BY85_9BACT|nr:radical SAM protein [Aquirufa rosea]
MESFYTIQGEGKFQGHAAYFIRLGGCDVGCHWCDVKESWPIDTHPIKTVKELVEEASAQPGKIVVITGGEPLMHDLNPLTEALHEAGFRTHIETSGVAKEITGVWDWVCFSPKKFKEPNSDIFPLVNELKVIIYHPSDLSWAQTWTTHLPENSLWLMQPEWSKQLDMNPLIVDFVKQSPRWQISVQTHKFLQIP